MCDVRFQAPTPQALPSSVVIVNLGQELSSQVLCKDKCIKQDSVLCCEAGDDSPAEVRREDHPAADTADIPLALILTSAVQYL